MSYADQRYYATGAGRFMTADPSDANDDFEDPVSLNRFAYGNGDPINRTDTEGLNSSLIVMPPISIAVPGGTWRITWQTITYGFGSYFFIPSQLFVPAAAVPPPPAPTTPNGVSSKSQAPASLQNALDGLSGNCILQMGRDRNALKNTAVNLKFWDARPDKDGLLTANTIAPGSGNTMIKDIRFGSAAFVLSVNGRQTNNVVLRGNFFTLATAADQKAVLVHELLHYHFNKGDDDLARQFGIYDPRKSSSERITDWIKAGCDKSRLK